MIDTDRNISIGKVYLIFWLCIGVSRASAQNPVKIGVICPLTGPYRLEATTQKNFATLATDEINEKGGILGRRVETVIRDSQLKTGIGIQQAQSLIDQGITYLTGGLSSDVVLGISKLAAKHKVLYFGVGGSNDLTGIYCNRYHFNLLTAAYQMAKGTGGIVLDKVGLPKEWFCITADYSWGQTCFKSVKQVLKQHNGKIVGNVMVPLQETDFSEALLLAYLSKAPVLCVIVYGQAQANLLEQAYKVGITNQKMKIVVIATDITIMFNLQPEVIKGVYVGLPWYCKLDNPIAQELTRKYISRFKHPPAWPGVTVYDSIQVMAMAMAKAKSFKVKDLIPAIEGFEFTTSKGPETIRACDHRAIQDWYVGVGKSKQQMNDPYDVLNIIGQTGGEAIMEKCDQTGCDLSRP